MNSHSTIVHHDQHIGLIAAANMLMLLSLNGILVSGTIIYIQKYIFSSTQMYIQLYNHNFLYNANQDKFKVL